MPYLTPNSIPAARVCRRIYIPDEPYIVAAVMGAIYDLTREWNWQQFGEIEPAEIAQAMIYVNNDFANSDGCMIGAIIPYITTTPPPNTLVCDGTVYNRADYPTLYDKLPLALRIDANTFRTPDLRGKFILAASDEIAPLSEGGEAEITLTISEMPEHTHTSQAHSHTNTPHDHVSPPHEHVESGAAPTAVPPGEIPIPIPVAVPAPLITAPAVVSILPNSVAIDPATVTINSTGGSEPHENMPPYYALAYCVVAR